MSTDLGLLRKAWPFLRTHRWLYGLGLLAAPASAALVITQPLLLKVAIDRYIVPGDLDGIRTAALLYLGAVIAAFALEAVYTLAMSYAAMRTIADVRSAVYTHTLSLSRSFFDTRPTGRLLTRATSDVEALGETLTAGAITIVLDVLLVVGILIAMLSLDAKLTLVLLAFAPLVAFFLDRLRRVLRRLYAEVRDSLADLNAFTSERLFGVEVVQLYSDEARTLGRFDERLDRYRDATVRTNVWDALLYAVIDGLSSIAVALMLWYGAGGIFAGTVTAGLLVAFIDYISKLFQPIQEFSAKIAILQRATTALEKIFGLLDETERITPGEVPEVPLLGRIDVQGLHFAYAGGPDVLRGVDLSVRPGEVIAVVGRTGSGKTTLGKLLTRAYDGYRGSITVDGRELCSLDPSTARRAIGTVQQDVQLFPGDVRFNLTLGSPIPDERLREVIGLARAERAVAELGGLDGRVAHEGANLSVGEAQLLSFARAMAYDPPVLILDEATASVDTLTEALIQEATSVILERKTVVVIAHRLSTIVNADRIAVMEAGRVAEIGSHGELMGMDGLYAQLFRQQFAEHGDADVSQPADGLANGDPFRHAR